MAKRTESALGILESRRNQSHKENEDEIEISGERLENNSSKATLYLVGKIWTEQSANINCFSI